MVQAIAFCQGGFFQGGCEVQNFYYFIANMIKLIELYPVNQIGSDWIKLNQIGMIQSDSKEIGSNSLFSGAVFF